MQFVVLRDLLVSDASTRKDDADKHFLKKAFPPKKVRPRPAPAIQKGTRVLISLWDSLMFGRGPKNGAAFLGTRPNMSESHSEISTRVPFCIQSGH